MGHQGKSNCRKVNRRDAGQLLPMVAVILFAVALMALVVVRLGMQVDRRAQAQAAADAVALAGAAEGEDRAGSVAEANGVVLESFEARGHEVEVVVRLGDERATARARRQW
jgi:Flp pilus assembly protein TadG